MIAALLLTVALSPPPGPGLTVAFSPADPAVGDLVTATLTARLPVEELTGAPRAPAWGALWGDAEIVEAGPIRTVGRGPERALEQEVALRLFRTGRVELPPVEFVAPTADGSRTLRPTEPIVVEIRSLVEGELEGALPRPPKPPRPLPLGGRFWWSVAALLLPCLALLALAHRRRQSGGVATEIPATPLERLRRDLDRLDRLVDEDPARQHAALSLALRAFLAAELRFPARESTTREIRRQLEARHLPAGFSIRAATLLSACDGVKFARRSAGRERLDERRTTACELADELVEHLRPGAASSETAEPSEAAA